MVEDMVKIVGNIFILFLSCAITLEARITMEIRAQDTRNNQVVIGQPFTLEVTVEDLKGSGKAPIIKGLEECTCRLVGTYMSTINGKSTTRYSYTVRIDALG